VAGSMQPRSHPDPGIPIATETYLPSPSGPQAPAATEDTTVSVQPASVQGITNVPAVRSAQPSLELYTPPAASGTGGATGPQISLAAMSAPPQASMGLGPLDAQPSLTLGKALSLKVKRRKLEAAAAAAAAEKMR
jgi:hypothetical protein